MAKDYWSEKYEIVTEAEAKRDREDLFIKRAKICAKNNPPVIVRTPDIEPIYVNYAPRIGGGYVGGYARGASLGGYAPVMRINEHRGLLKNMFFGLLTLGFYPFVVTYRMSQEINLIASRYDGKRTMNFAMLMLVMVFTVGIGYLVWETKFCARIKNELERRGINYKFGAGSFWGWNTIGCLLFGLGPLIFTHKRCKAMNLLAQHYNTYG